MKTIPGYRKVPSERGAVLVLFALSMVMLFAFAAIAVDTAHAFVERRDSQSTADVSAIGGAITLIGNTGDDTAKAGDLVDEVMRIAALNLDTPLDWAGCTDPERPAEFTVVASAVFTVSADVRNTDCISWSADFLKVRVKIPVRSLDTYFARVIGFETIDVDAFAEVEAMIQGSGGTLPFGVLNNGTAGLVCLKTGPKFPEPECSRNSEGNFGFLDFALYGNGAMKTNTKCTGDTIKRLTENIAHGIDHDLVDAPPPPEPPPPVTNQDIQSYFSSLTKDLDGCPPVSNNTYPKVQATTTETGTKDGEVIRQGFVTGINGFDGRLTKVSGSTTTYDWGGPGGPKIDDMGLWEYLDPTLTASGAACDGANTEAAVITCMNENSGPIFTRLVDPGDVDSDYLIQRSARLARVPLLWQSEWPSGNGYVSFQEFVFVYIQTVYGGCSPAGVCSLEIEPGASGVKNWTSQKPAAVTAIIIPEDRLPEVVRNSFGAPQVTGFALAR